MTPYISLWRRVIAWLLWRFEGYDKMTMDEAGFYVLEHPEATRVASLMRDYWYAKKAGDAE